MRRLVTLVAALALVVSACSSGTGGGGGTSNAKIAFLMPDIASTRYELYDSPLFKAKVKQLCADCEVLYQNANADADASRQQQ
jgi:simple sugar transport system substrate-binding protein/D-xylose transport system substrate-binding protein